MHITITWKKDKRQYANGEHGIVGKVCLFYACWDSARSKGERLPNYKISSYLPGIESVRFDTIEECHRWAARAMAVWLDRIGVPVGVEE